MGDDFTGPQPMPRPDQVTAYPGQFLTSREPDMPSITLEHDPERNQFVMVVEHIGGTRQEAVLPQSVVDALAARWAVLASPPEPEPTAQPTGLQFQVTAVVYEMMGAEGAAFIRKPVRHDPTESIQSLATRAFSLDTPYHRHHAGDRLEVQVIPESIPETTGGKGLLDF